MVCSLLFLFACRGAGCLPGSLQGDVDGQRFVRCSQADAPRERSVRVGQLALTIKDRTLRIEGAQSLRVVAFTGPVGSALEPADLSQIRAAQPSLVLYLGGLGDSLKTARQNLASLAALRVPTLFVAGGADRMPVLEAAFDALAEGERDSVLNATGLREVRFGTERLVLVPGAPLGRYALDEQSCGLTREDFQLLAADAKQAPVATRSWLLSFQAPVGFGVSAGFGGSELGSPEVQTLAHAVGAEGGLFAYPEGQAGAARAAKLALVLPRLSRVGSLRSDGSRLAGQVALVFWSGEGLVASP